MRKKIKILTNREKMSDLLFGSNSKAARVFDLCVIIAIIMSLVILLVESLPKVAGTYKLLLQITEYIVTAFFTVEYILRLCYSPNRKEYAFSFYGIIDFLATVPPYFAYFLPAARYMLAFRAFRCIRVFRVFRLFVFMNEGYLLMESIKKSLTKILVYFLFVWILVICIGTVMYIIEGSTPDSQFTDIPTSIYWAIVTLTTVGYGDITPVTAVGRFLSSLVMILGYTIIAVPTGIVSATLIDTTREKVRDGRCPRCQEKVDKADKYCRHCGEKL